MVTESDFNLSLEILFISKKGKKLGNPEEMKFTGLPSYHWP